MTFERDSDAPNPEEESKKWYSNKWNSWKDHSDDKGSDKALVTDWSSWTGNQEARPSTGWNVASVVKSEADAPAKDSNSSSTAVSDCSADQRSADNLAGTWGADYIAKQEAAASVVVKQEAAASVVPDSEPVAGHIPAVARWSNGSLKNLIAEHPAP